MGQLGGKKKSIATVKPELLSFMTIIFQTQDPWVIKGCMTCKFSIFHQKTALAMTHIDRCCRLPAAHKCGRSPAVPSWSRKCLDYVSPLQSECSPDCSRTYIEHIHLKDTSQNMSTFHQRAHTPKKSSIWFPKPVLDSIKEISRGNLLVNDALTIRRASQTKNSCWALWQ